MSTRESHESHERKNVVSELRHHQYGAAGKELAHELHSHPKEFEHMMRGINHDLASKGMSQLSVEHDKQNRISHINFGNHDIYDSHSAKQGGHRGDAAGHGQAAHGGEGQGGKHQRRHGKGHPREGQPADDQDQPDSKGSPNNSDKGTPGKESKDSKDSKDPKNGHDGDKDKTDGTKPSVKEMVHLVKEVAKELGLSKHATTGAVAAMLQESGGDPNKRGDYGKKDHKPHSFGLFQLNFTHGEGKESGITPQQALNPRTNAEVALKYFKQHDNGGDPVNIAKKAQRAGDPGYYTHVAKWVPTANRLIAER